MHRYRTHTCGALRKSDVGTSVRLSGWVHRVRDHGGVLFIDLRDHYGLTQIVADPDSKAFKSAEAVRSEWVIRVDAKKKELIGNFKNPGASWVLDAIVVKDRDFRSEANALVTAWASTTCRPAGAQFFGAPATTPRPLRSRPFRSGGVRQVRSDTRMLTNC